MNGLVSRYLRGILGVGVALATIFAAPVAAQAITLYVSNAPGAVGSPPGTGCAAGEAGYAAIQDAIDAAAIGGDSIFVCPGTYTDGPYTVEDKDIAFSGAGDGEDPALNTIIDGGLIRDGFRFTTASLVPPEPAAAVANITTSFTDFRFVDNVAPNLADSVGGSAIRPVGLDVLLSATVTDSTLTGNSTPEGTEDVGGAIFAEDLTVTGSTFSTNYSDDEGGAVYATDSLVVTGSTFSGNEAESDDGGAAVGAEVTITDSTFTGNFISDAGSSDNGGAVRAESATVTGSDFDSNTTLPEDDSNTYGGAIYSAGGVDVEDSTFTENVASDGGGAIYGEDGDDGPDVTGSTFTGNVANQFLTEDQEGAGGAIFWGDDPSYELEVVDSVFGGAESGDGNQSRFGGAIRSGGAIIVRGTGAEGTESRFEGNLSARAGGAIRCGGDCASTTVINTAFIGNSAIGDDEFDPEADGGAIGTGGVTGTGIPLVVEDSTFTSNIALADGGAIEWGIGDLTILDSNFTTNQAGADGGAVAADTTGYEFVVDGSTFDRNSNTDSGVEVEADGGAIFIDLGPPPPDPDEEEIQGFVVSSDFTDNTSDDDGGAIYVNDGNLYVGDDSGPFLVGAESVTGCPEFSGNQAFDNGGAIYQSGEGIGYLSCSTEGEDLTLADNTAGGDGGAIRWGPTATSEDDFSGIYVLGASLTGNDAVNGSGGAIRSGGAMYSFDSQFDQNLSGGDGGGVSALGVLGQFSEFTGNTAVNGGAVSAFLVALGGSLIADNEALGDGGGLHLPSPSPDQFGTESGLAELELVELTGNTATGDGGAMMVAGEAELIGATISDNEAAGYGGGIAAFDPAPPSEVPAEVYAFATTFDGNLAERGGAIYSDDAAFSGPVSFIGGRGDGRSGDFLTREGIGPMNGPSDDGSTFSNNTATEGGGAVSVGQFSFLTNSTVTGNTGPAAVELDGAGDLVFQNSTIADNEPEAGPVLAAPGGDLAMANTIVAEDGTGCSLGESASAGGNVVSTETIGCADFVGGDEPSVQTRLSPVQIGLEPLADNGGLTETMALAPTSVALDTALPLFCPEQDQRGEARPPTECDPGAYEYTGALYPVLEVEKPGTGTGLVAAEPSGIQCGPTCYLRYQPDEVVTLTASPTNGSTFNGWTGAGCSGTGTCEVTMNRARTVQATFTAGPAPSTGIRVRKWQDGVNPVTGTRRIRIARVKCLVGTCDIQSATVSFSARRKVFQGTALVGRPSLQAGQITYVTTVVPRAVYSRLRSRKSGLASLLVRVVDPSDQTRVVRGVKVGLRRAR
jgi:predicted outer membrane repeat protein